MQPVSFGTSDRQLLGIYYPPEGEQPRDAAVLLCGPAPQEYMLTYWATRKLATLLARHGFPVMRFDYFGTGDSAGETEEGRPRLWVEDVGAAARELLDSPAELASEIIAKVMPRPPGTAANAPRRPGGAGVPLATRVVSVVLTTACPNNIAAGIC